MAMVIFPLLLLLLLPFVAAQWQSCGNSGNYTSNSIYEANLRLLSSTLPKKAASNATLFATDMVGDTPDTIFALTLCRGDTTNASACEDCVATAFQDGPRLCPYNKDVTIYYDPCMLRFSNKNFLATTDNSVLIFMNFTTSFDSTRRLLFTLLNTTAQLASDVTRRFTTSLLDVNSYPTLYCLMQCTPDLTAEDCAVCFQDVSQLTLQYLDGKQGGRVLGTRCSMRYEIYPFFHREPMLRITNLAAEVPAINNTPPGSTPVTVYGSPPVAPAAAPPPDRPVVQTNIDQQGRNSRKRALLIVAVAAPLLSVLLCFICSVVWLRRRRKGKINLRDEAAMNRPEEDALVWRLEEKSSDFTLFDFSEILHATCNFSKENLLGRGGFGPVYKG